MRTGVQPARAMELSRAIGCGERCSDHATCRAAIEHDVVDAYQQELERSKQPGYIPPSLDHEDIEFDEDRSPNLRLRPTGTSH